MKKYYLHNGTESSGPYDIEQLKLKNIIKSTPVWFEGMQHWKTAGEIPELNHLFIINPPPFSLFETPEHARKVELKKEVPKILGLTKNIFFLVLGFVLLLVGITVLKNIEETKIRELKIKNHKTEVENYQLELQQKELEEQKIQSAIQEKIETERKTKAQKTTISNRLSEIEQLVLDYNNNISETEKKLGDAANFKLLRTGEEKRQQIDLLQKNIDSFKIEINRLIIESDQLKLELEKIPQ